LFTEGWQPGTYFFNYYDIMSYDRYDLNQLSTEPWIQNQDERQMIKMSWSIVSKAAERSSKQRRDAFCDPVTLTR